MKHNAKTKAQKAVVALIEADPMLADSSTVIEFEKGGRVSFRTATMQMEFPTLEEFSEWAKPQDEAQGPAAKPKGKRGRKKAEAASVDPDAQEGADEGSTAEADFEAAVGQIVTAIVNEAGHSLTANTYRWQKGHALNQANAVGSALPESVTGGNALAYARLKVAQSLESAGIIDALSHLGDAEVSITRGAATAWLGPKGLEGTFQLIDTFGPDGEPLLNDKGKPYVRKVTEVSVNKAYSLARLPALDVMKDRLLSFAFTQSEKTCLSLNRLCKLAGIKSRKALDSLLDTIYNDSKITGDNVDTVIRARLAELRGDTGLASITIAKELFEGDWADTRRAATEAWAFIGGAIGEKDGLIGNSVLLERLLQYFVPRDFGMQGVARMLVDSGEMTEAQQKAFLAQHALTDPDDDEDEDDFDLDDVSVNVNVTQHDIEMHAAADDEFDVYDDHGADPGDEFEDDDLPDW